MSLEMRECPVCTLFLRPGISLKEHLHTHPKDQVIDALLKCKELDNENRSPGLPQDLSCNAVTPTSPPRANALTYQHVLNSNRPGPVVPKFVPVNSQFPIPQNMGYPPPSFNPLYNPYLSHSYPFHNHNKSVIPSSTHAASPPPDNPPTAADDEEGSIEVNVCISSPSPPPPTTPSPSVSLPIIPSTHSVIISRQRTTPSSPLSSPSKTEDEEAIRSDSLPMSSPRSSACASPPAKLVICKVEEGVIVEHHQVKTRDIKHEDIKIEKIESCSTYKKKIEKKDVLIYDSKEQFNCELNNDSQKDGNLIFGLPGVDIKLVGVQQSEGVKNLSFSYSDNAGNCNDSGNSNMVYTDLIPTSTSPLHDLLPATRLHELLPTASATSITKKSANSYMLIDSSKMLFSSISRPSTPPSVIHVVDSIKPNISSIPLNIAADESMPARGELSEQESLEADCAWAMGMFQQDVKTDPWPEETKVFECPTCHLGFTGLKELEEHKTDYHVERKPGKFKCEPCGAMFQTTRDRRSHMYLHKAIKTEIKIKEGEIESSSSHPTPASALALNSTSPKNCPVCSVNFLTLKDLRIHLRKVHHQIRYKCEDCDSCFDDELDLNDHLKVHPLKCKQCGKLFYRRANLALHMRRHLSVKPFECSHCNKSFITRQKLEEHVNSHTGSKPIKCNQCPKTFGRHSNLIQHRNTHHRIYKRKIKDFVCRCGDIFHSLRKLEWHKEIHENKPKSCPFCSQKFIHAASVTRHVRRSHLPDYLPEASGRENENVSCPICDRVFLRSSLSVHMRVHNGDKPFQCNICSKLFTTKWNMELHQWTHQSRSAMPFKCNLCKSAFFREVDFQSHLNAHKNLKPFICNLCGQKFIRKYNCLRHQEEHKQEKRFACTVAGCDRVFHRNYYLRDHMKIHTGVRPHTCHICGKASSTKSNHNKHVKIHDTRELVNSEN